MNGRECAYSASIRLACFDCQSVTTVNHVGEFAARLRSSVILERNNSLDLVDSCTIGNGKVNCDF